MRSLTERKGRGDARGRQAARPLRVLPKVQPGSARRGRAQKKGFLARLVPSRRIVALTGSLLLLATLLALAVTGILGRAFQGVRVAGNTVSSDAGFSIRSIHIAGARRTPAATIAAALDLHEHQSIFAADLAAARARLLALDWVASADVVRRYPDSISVTIVEKRPFALWQAPDGAGNARILVVERSGGVITGKEVEGFSHLPKLVGAGAPAAAAELVDAVQSHRAVSARIAAYEFVSQRRWNLILNDGVVVKLPEQGWPKEIDALERLIIDRGILERNISEIDLRSPTQYFFVLRSGEHKDEARGKET